MKLKDEIMALLPTQISRWILGATLILPPLTYAFCPDLFSLFPKLSESNKLLIRLLSTETVALFGLLSLVASLISYNHKNPTIKSINEEAIKYVDAQNSDKKLDASSEQVLLTFFDEATELSVLHFERLCIFQGINGVQYYIDELLKHDYIRKNSGDHDPNVTYIISSKGRKYVMEIIQNHT